MSGNIYYEPIDSIIKKLKGKIVLQEQNVNFPDTRRVTDAQQHQTAFEYLVKIVPNNLELLGNYQVDTIWLFSNKKKLIKCLYQFKLPANGYMARDKAIDTIYKTLNKGFNLDHTGVETNLFDYGGFVWTDDFAEVDFLNKGPLYGTGNDFADDLYRSGSYLLIEFFKPVEKNVLLEKQTAQIKADRSGKGNSTFNISIAKLEDIVIFKTTLKGLEAQLGNWNSYGNLNEIGAEYDDNTKNFTIPLFQIHYETTIKNNGYLIEAYVSKNLKNPVKELRITTTLNGYQFAQFKESLHTHGYLLNENLSATLNKLSYNNKAGRLITIRYNENGSYTFGITK